ncbi:MAG: tyrosine-type recombinase/integrase [Chloroflexota bacterium]
MNTSLDKLINGFKLSNEAAGLSPRTTQWYDRILKSFLKWLKQQGHPIEADKITAPMIREYITTLQTKGKRYVERPFHPKEERPMSPCSVRGHCSSLSAFFNWAEREELITENPMRKIPKPKVPKLLLAGFSQTEVQALIKACASLPEDTALREKAIILFLVDTGVRISELLSLTTDNLKLEEGRALVMGKGAKERYVFLGKATKKALWKYFSFGRPEPAPNVNRVFITRSGRPLRYRNVSTYLRQLI